MCQAFCHRRPVTKHFWGKVNTCLKSAYELHFNKNDPSIKFYALVSLLKELHSFIIDLIDTNNISSHIIVTERIITKRIINEICNQLISINSTQN